MQLTCLLIATLGHVLFYAAQPALAVDAVWVQPSGNWFGIDGDWSSFGFGVGAPMQHVELTVNTALSEIWVVENTGCSQTIACFNARGGVFDPDESSSWQPLGGWDLGMKQLPFGGNGDYGLETLVFTDTLSSTTTGVDAAIVAAINSTDYYQGYLGLGINPGRFGTVAANPLIIQLAETYGSIPSHSYGYTAGASFAAKTPASLTLGGYDKLRYKPQDVNFHLDGNNHTPSVNLRGITVNTPIGSGQYIAEPLLSMNESLTAIIDTSTPYLWLPEAVCERFATELGLQWNGTLGLYVFDNGSQYNDYLNSTGETDMSFTFSVSSYDYLDDFAQPLALPGVVNITVPAAAFAHLLRYPFQGVIRVTDSSVPYFALKRAAANGPFIIGRAFMHAAYMILNYETGSFSLHEALYPNNPATNISIVNVERSPTSPYPAYTPPVGQKTGLKIPAIVGVVIAIILAGCVVLAIWWCCRRRRKNKHAEKGGDMVEEPKEETESIESELPRSPVRRMMSRIIGRKKSKKPMVHEVHGDDTQPTEFAADATHEVFEMPVPLEPVELDSTGGGGTEDMTEFGTNSSHGLTPYEIARRKLDRQLQGPVPIYTPASPISPVSPTSEKTGQDVSPMPHYRPGDDPSPASSPTYANSNSMPNSLPSPMTPHPGGVDWTNRNFDLPSPMTVAPPFPSPQFSRHNNTDPNTSPLSPVSPNSLHSFRTRIPSELAPVMTNRSNDSSEVSPVSPGIPIIPPSQYQRTPIDPSRVICLGPLPGNVQLPRIRPTIPRLITPDGRVINSIRPSSAGGTPQSPLSPIQSGHRRQSTTSTLGSNFTEDEANHGLRDGNSGQRHDRPDERTEGTDSFPRSPQSMERIDGGSELVHVPQLADKRYSWEDTR